MVQLLLRIAGSGYWYGSPLNFRSLFHIILVAGAMGCTGLWLAYPEGMPSKIQAAAGGASAAASAAASAVNSAAGTVASAVSDGANGNGFIAMTQHILLLLLTCGIWLYIWIYRCCACSCPSTSSTGSTRTPAGWISWRSETVFPPTSPHSA